MFTLRQLMRRMVIRGNRLKMSVLDTGFVTSSARHWRVYREVDKVLVKSYGKAKPNSRYNFSFFEITRTDFALISRFIKRIISIYEINKKVNLLADLMFDRKKINGLE